MQNITGFKDILLNSGIFSGFRGVKILKIQEEVSKWGDGQDLAGWG